MSARLYVGNLSFDATSEDLEEIFSAVDTVTETTIVTRPGGGRPRGFGFVEMASLEGANEAIRQLNGQSVGGRALVVNLAKGREQAERAS